MLPEYLSSSPNRALACAVVGRWAFETGWFDAAPLERARPHCRDDQLAIGVGIALAPRRLRWWWSDTDVSADAQAAFLCAFESELHALEGPDLPDLPLRCAR